MDRTQLLFKTLVECYIRDGQPVGSRYLLEMTSLPLSPATVRNVMAQLEEKGLLAAPHTSAGRVPTQQGYRLFVDRLLTTEAVNEETVKVISEELSSAQSPGELVQKASACLAELSRHAGLVMVPRRDLVDLRHIEFVRLDERRVLAIVVCANGDVQNQLIHTERPFGEAELEQAGNYLNHHFAGKNLGEITRGLLCGLRDDQRQLDHLLRGTVTLAERAFAPKPTGDYVLSGEANLVRLAETGGVDRLQELFQAFTAKRDILHLLDRCQQSEGVEIYIGAESGYAPFGDLTLVTAPYGANGRVLGRLAVIGPTRMAYQRVIPLVEVTANILSRALSSS
ncbi:MAG: heat-inducible transcription repressor HrcA [Moraxellaceae bacterium]|jgi:heat-inducible transcriptional repressor|nr:heat-inducible transcription repressor HrcA [Moraxellaceae bacterium]MDF3030711.1 heat-inducible transcription repressor HrcA [Moraxellaceae bacterium]